MDQQADDVGGGPGGRPIDGPGMHRTVMLTDAVVAIAMTLLVLPLVEVAGEIDPAHLGVFLGEQWDLLLSFAVSFLVIYVFWAAHGTAVRRADAAGVEPPVLRRLTIWWLLVVAFLPFPTAIIGHEVTAVTAPVYIGTMFVLSVLTSVASQAVDNALGRPRDALWAWATTAVFGLCAVISALAPVVGMVALLLLAVVRAVETRVRSARRAG